MTNTVPPEIPQREVISRRHQLVVWLSLDSLNPYWATLPPVGPDPALVRAAAQAGLRDWHAAAGSDAPEAWFLARLANIAPPQLCTAMQGFMDAVLRVQTSEALGYWKSWMGQNQHRPVVPGMDPAAATALMKLYRDEVVTKPKAAWADLRAAIKATPLSDWDMSIHADYGFCTEETDQFAESVLLSGLATLRSDLHFNSFIAQHVLALPAQDQACLLAAVRAEWADLWADEADDLGTMLPGAHKTPQDAGRIPPAAEVVVWL